MVADRAQLETILLNLTVNARERWIRGEWAAGRCYRTLAGCVMRATDATGDGSAGQEGQKPPKLAQACNLNAPTTLVYSDVRKAQ